MGDTNYKADYLGDTNYNSSTSSCEPLTVSKASPTILTQFAQTTITLGGSTTDKATVSGGFSPGGTVTFNVFTSTTCTGTPVFTSANKPLSGGMATSDSFQPGSIGTFRWLATYNGDANNNAVTSTCGVPSETLTVNAPPQATLTVIKHVINHGGSKVASNFQITASSNGCNPSPSTFQGSETGTAVTLTIPFGGSCPYTVTEVQDPNYTATFSSDCSSTITSSGQIKTCTITNEQKTCATTLTLGILPTTVSRGGTALLKGLLTDCNGNPVSGKTLTFTATGPGPVSIPSVITDQFGIFRGAWIVPLTQTPGNYIIKANFAGMGLLGPTMSAGKTLTVV